MLRGPSGLGRIISNSRQRAGQNRQFKLPAQAAGDLKRRVETPRKQPLSMRRDGHQQLRLRGCAPGKELLRQHPGQRELVGDLQAMNQVAGRGAVVECGVNVPPGWRRIKAAQTDALTGGRVCTARATRASRRKLPGASRAQPLFTAGNAAKKAARGK